MYMLELGNEQMEYTNEEVTIRTELRFLVGNRLHGFGVISNIIFMTEEPTFRFKVLLHNIILQNGIALDHCWISCIMIEGFDIGQHVAFEGTVYRYKKELPNGKRIRNENGTVQRKFTDYGLMNGFFKLQD